jgi:hypothetical protein
MRPRPPAPPALLLLALVLAGCAAQPPPEPGPGSAALAGWRLDCLHAANWSDPCTSRSTLANGPANENFLAVNPTDPMNVVTGAKDYNPDATDCVWAGVASTHDGGRTWDNAYIGGLKAERDADPTNPLFGFQCVTDPMMAFGSEGTLYYLVEAYGRTPHPSPVPVPVLGSIDAAGNTLFVAVSKDGGKTWPLQDVHRVWDGEPLVLFNDKSCLITNPQSGSVHVSWSQFTLAGPTQALVSTSRDGAQSWSVPVLLSSVQGSTATLFPVCLAAAKDGTVYATWHDWGTSQVMFSTSTDDGATFREPVAIQSVHPVFETAPNAHFRIVTQPYAAVDNSGGPRDGTIYLGWEDNQSGQLDLLLTWSSDGGQTWADPVDVTPGTGGSDQFHVSMAVDDRGALHLAYYDRSYTPGNKLLDLTWAIAPDGRDFTRLRVTNGSFDGDLGFHQDGFPFIGDYNGIGCAASRGGGPGGPDAVCYASFADTRDGRSEVAVARMVRA